MNINCANNAYSTPGINNNDQSTGCWLMSLPVYLFDLGFVLFHKIFAISRTVTATAATVARRCRQ